MTDLKITSAGFTNGTPADIRRGLLGYVTCILNDTLVIDGVTLRRTRDGRLALSFPARRDGRGRTHPVVRPVDDDARLDDLLRTRFADVRKIRCGGLLTRAWEGTLFAHPQELPGWFVNAAAIPGTLLAWLDWLGPKGHLIYICNGKRSD